MISLLSALALCPIHQGIQIPSQNDDPTHIRGAAINVNIGAGGDGLRSDSTLYTDLIFTDGTLFQGKLARGIADNRGTTIPLQDKWPSPGARLSYVNSTLTGNRGGTESTDDFDLRSLTVNVQPLTGGNLRMFHNNSINFRLHGVGTWTTGQLEPMSPMVSGQPVQSVEADLYIGDKPMKSRLSLGLKIAGNFVWGDMATVGQASQLGYIHVIFNFLAPVAIAACSQAAIRQQNPSYKNFTLNGLLLYFYDMTPSGTQKKVIFTQAMNANAKIAYNAMWTSSPISMSLYGLRKNR